jgi:hypothetical protein
MSTPLPSTRHNSAISAQTGIRREVQVTLSRGGTSLTVEPTAMSLTQDSRRTMRWDGTMTIADESLIPTSPSDILTPFGTFVDVSLGIELLDGTTSIVPYGHFAIAKSRAQTDPGNAVVEVSLIDPAEIIERYRFEEPLVIASGTDLAGVVNAVVASRTGSNPNIANVGSKLGADRTLGLDPETGPWSELLDILDSFGLTAWYNRVGNIVVGTLNVSTATIKSLAGNTSLEINFDAQPSNVIVVRGEPPDVEPVQAVALDDDPSSPTYAGESPGSSAYGRVTRFYSSPLIYTEAQAQQVAQQLLQNSIGGGASRTATRAYDPTIDPLDVYAINGQTCVIDSITVDITDNTTIQVRDLV